MTKNVFYGLAIGIALVLSTIVVVRGDIQATNAEISTLRAVTKVTPTPTYKNTEPDEPTPNATITVGELREMLGKIKNQSLPVVIKLDGHLMRNLGGVSSLCATPSGNRDYFFKHCDAYSIPAVALEWGL